MVAIAEVVAKSSELQQRENSSNVSKRRQVVMKETPGAMRYFIARENGVASLPQLGKEFSSEKEAHSRRPDSGRNGGSASVKARPQEPTQ